MHNNQAEAPPHKQPKLPMMTLRNDSYISKLLLRSDGVTVEPIPAQIGRAEVKMDGRVETKTIEGDLLAAAKVNYSTTPPINGMELPSIANHE